MGRLKIPSSLRLEDVKAEYREVLEVVSKSVNPFMEDVYAQMNGQITFENLNRTASTIDVKIDSSGKVINEPQVRISGIRGRVIGINVISAENLNNTNTYPLSCPFITYTLGTETLTIKNVTGLQADSKYRLVLEIIGN